MVTSSARSFLRSFPLVVGLLFIALVALVLACSGADGDPAPLVPEAGADAGVVIVSCVDGAAP